MPEGAGEAGAGGLLDSLKSLGRSLIALARTRLEILGSEIEERQALLLREVLLAVTAAVCLGLGVVLVVLFFVLLLWDSHRLLVVGLSAAVFLVASGAAVALLRATIRRQPRLFSATLEELAKDRESLR